MRYSEARLGRVFVLRLEDGDIVHETIERFAEEQGITAASLIAVGGADHGSRLVVGPKDDRGLPILPMQRELDHAHEVAGVGTLFCDPDGVPLVHMHMACGRQGETITGCIRPGVKTWQVLEVIMHELVDSSARRALEQPLNLKLLQP